MLNEQPRKHFYIFDYFLDGYFLKSEEVQGNCPACGEYLTIALDNGTEIMTQVMEIEFISEDERRILLTSC
ncbi:MAG: hypothetical protein Tsb0014_39170 [Pleurocapsa sp.]